MRAVCCLLLATGACLGLPRTLTITAGDRDLTGCPLVVAVAADEAPRAVAYTAGGAVVPAQVAAGDFDDAARELSLVLPGPAAGGTLTLTLSDQTPAAPAFAWTEPAAGELLLSVGDRPVLRYMHAALDESTAAARESTYKVYHHLYSPDGTRLVTKGLGGQFPHHRGIFYGFNKVSYGGYNCDIWHCKGASQTHDTVEATAGGPVFGRHRVRLRWNGKDGVPFAMEQRVLTAWSTPGGTVVDFASRLTSEVDGLTLDGDPQHAGFHFRADNEVSEKTKGQTYYVRPDGAGKPGETRNWPAQREHVNLAFDAMSFVLGEQRFTVAYLDRQENPKEARFSERDYGRFGSYFEQRLNRGEVLEVRYRLQLRAGEMTVDDVARLAALFTSPPIAQATP